MEEVEEVALLAHASSIRLYYSLALLRNMQAQKPNIAHKDTQQQVEVTFLQAGRSLDNQDKTAL